MTTSILRLPRFDAGSDEVAQSRELKATFGAVKSVPYAPVVVTEVRSGLVRKFTVGNAVESLTRRPILEAVARDWISLDVFLNATRSRIIVGTIDL